MESRGDCMPFTQAQEAAITATNRELLVSAAAGSGKTRVLIERIFYMLQSEGLSLDRLLVVTFTHAAAAEMRERLQARIAEAALKDKAMRAQVELLETAQISTLHSFCQKLVREYFQEVDIDPQSMLGDETICANLRAQAKTDALDWLYEQAVNGDEPARALTAKFDEKQIDRMVDELYPFLMAVAEPFEWLERHAQKVYTMDDLTQGEMAQTLLADCGLLVNGIAELATLCETLMQNPLWPDKYSATVRADKRAADALQTACGEGLPALISHARQFTLERLPALRGIEGEEAQLRDQYKTYRDRMKKLAAGIASHLPEEPATAIHRLNAMQPALRGLAKLTREMDTRYTSLKRERTLLDFNDLERLALQILKNPAIGQEVAARFDGVFVDEYQDISCVQEAILNAVKRDVSRETNGVPQRYFYVGDVKQSIYRFRQADPSLFMGKARTYVKDERAPQRRISLNANFRSRQNVLASVNRVFEHVMRQAVTEIDYDEEARLYPGSPSTGDAPTSLHLFTQPVKAAQRVKLQAYAIAQEIRRRVGEPVYDREGNAIGSLHYRDIAILGPKMKDVSAVLERTLGEMGIPVYCEDRGSGMASEEIMQALTHLRLMDNLADDLALIACLRSPAMGFGERELAQIRLRCPKGTYLDAVQAAATGQDVLAAQCRRALDTLAHERFLLMETPLNEYLWGWLSRSGMYAFFGCQPNGTLRQANLRMLCEKAGEHVKRRGGDLHDFLMGIQAQTGVRDSASPTVLSPWEDVVRVMTIHKSKGLEFPVVFVMGLEEKFGARRGGTLGIHARLGVALPYVNEVARTTGDTVLKGAVDLRAQSEEKAERARLLYVAMTRARDELVLMGCGDTLQPEDAATGFAGQRQTSAYAVFSAGSMLEWVCQCVDQGDRAERWQQEDIINTPLRRTAPQGEFSIQSTINPQKNGVWRVVFHSEEAEVSAALRYAKGKGALAEPALRKAKLQALMQDARLAAENPVSNMDNAVAAAGGAAGYSAELASPSANTADPLMPAIAFEHHPFKIGATAYARAQQQAQWESLEGFVEEENDTAAAEAVDFKRLPLPLTRPKLMNDLPSTPLFMQPPAQQTGVRRGVATHKALSLFTFGGLRGAAGDAFLLRREVERQLHELVLQRLLTPEEMELVKPDTIARFFASPCGSAALASQMVKREWSFNLRLPEQRGIIVQGVIDLCFERDGQWSLVDYKTDRVETPEALWALYGGQMALYRRALTEATALPVRDITLFSLALGDGATHVG